MVPWLGFKSIVLFKPIYNITCELWYVSHVTSPEQSVPEILPPQYFITKALKELSNNLNTEGLKLHSGLSFEFAGAMLI